MINTFIYYLLILFIPVIFMSCGKKEDEKQQTELNADVYNETAAGENSVEGMSKWSGRYRFQENAAGITPGTGQSWDWEIVVVSDDKGSYKATISVDGFQTMTRIEADVIATDTTAAFIFVRYLPDNMFGSFKNGDRLFSLHINEKGEMVTDWEKMKPYVITNQKKGTVAFKKIIS